MPSKVCPHCGARLMLWDCRELLVNNRVACKNCNKLCQIRTKDIFRNAAVSGCIIGILAAGIMDTPPLAAGVLGFIFTIAFQRFIDFFYELEEADES